MSREMDVVPHTRGELTGMQMQDEDKPTWQHRGETDGHADGWNTITR